MMIVKIEFYLDETSDHELAQQVTKRFAGMEKRSAVYGAESVGGLDFRQNEHGIFVQTDNFLAGTPYAIQTQELPIRLVRLYDEGDDAWSPRLGIYAHDGVDALVETFYKTIYGGRRGSSFYSFGGDKQVKTWRLYASAPTFEELARFYRFFRLHEVEPVETWDQPTRSALAALIDRLELVLKDQLAGRDGADTPKARTKAKTH